MNEFDSPNYTEYTYDKKAEGKTLFLKWLLIFGYVSFVVLFFLACYITRIIPLFAICPVVTWIIVFFTWRLVSYDVYYTFEHGRMEIGKIRVRKSGNIKKVKVTLEMKDAILVAPMDIAKNREEFISAKVMHDYSAYRSSPRLVVIVFSGKKGNEVVMIENTPKLSRLVMRYSKNAVGLSQTTV